MGCALKNLSGTLAPSSSEQESARRLRSPRVGEAADPSVPAASRVTHWRTSRWPWPSVMPEHRMTSKPETKRAVAYLRVSSLSQVDGHSLDAQARLFNEICANRGWVPVNVYREEGASAHSESIKKRPMFRQLMEDAKKGAFDIVVVHTLDRWSRNLRVTLESLANLAMHDVALVSITEDIDYSTPLGMLMTQLLGSFLPLRQVVRIGVPSVEGRQLRRHFDALRRMRV